MPDLSWLEDASAAAQVLPFLRETPDDTGNARRFQRLFGTEVRYLASERVWLRWDGQRWARDERGEVFHLTEALVEDVRAHADHVVEDEAAHRVWARWASTTASLGRRKATLEVAATLPELVIGAGSLDAVPHLLNTPSGTIDLRDGSLRGFAREDQLTWLTGVAYDPQVVWTPLLAQYMNTFVPDYTEWRYLMKVLGAALLARNEFRLWLIMHGPTTTGKTQLVNALARVLGDYGVAVNSSVFRANLDDKPRPDLLRALSARLVYALEASENWELHGDHVKRLTGSEPIVARAMRSDTMVERVPDFTPLIVCNTIPRLKGNVDSGVRRRLRVLPFTNSALAFEDPAIRGKFAADGPTHTALLSQLVEGCVRAQQEGVEDIPARYGEATMWAFGELNPISAFLGWLEDAGQLFHDETYTAHRCWSATELYHSYTLWVAMYGSLEDQRGRLGLRAFNAELRDLGWRAEKSGGYYKWLGRVNTSIQPPRVVD